MNKCFMILACALVWAAVATAQIDPNQNGIGIYADLDGLVNEVEVAVGDPMEVYVLITRPTGTVKLGGWEAHIVVPDNISIWGWNFPNPGTLAFSTPPDFMAAHPPVAFQVVNHVMTFIVVPTDSEPAQFYIEPFPYTTPVPAPRYIDVEYGPDAVPGVLIDLVPYPAGIGNPSFTVNAGPLPTRAASWGEIKALYR